MRWQFCISFWYSLCKPAHEKTPGPIIYAKTSPQSISSHTLVEFKLGGWYHLWDILPNDESPGRLGAWEAYLPSGASYLVFSLQCLGIVRIGVTVGVSLGCHGWWYGFLPQIVFELLIWGNVTNIVAMYYFPEAVFVCREDSLVNQILFRDTASMLQQVPRFA